MKYLKKAFLYLSRNRKREIYRLSNAYINEPQSPYQCLILMQFVCEKFMENKHDITIESNYL